MSVLRPILATKALAAVLALALGCAVPAQGRGTRYAGTPTEADDTYKYDFGVAVGLSGYLGDANQSNLFSNCSFGGQLSWRYLPNPRWDIRTVLAVVRLSGDTANWDNALPAGEQYQFTATDFDLGVRLEFNFFNYGIGHPYQKLRRWTPFVGAGVGANLASCGGSTAVAPSVALALGVKYKLSQRLNLNAEWAMTKVFGDNVDGLKDLQGIRSSFVKNTDWTSLISVGISYEFGPRCRTCHYQD